MGMEPKRSDNFSLYLPTEPAPPDLAKNIHYSITMHSRHSTRDCHTIIVITFSTTTWTMTTLPSTLVT